MGFPGGYTEVFIPTLLIHTLTLLSTIKHLIFTLLHAFGLPPDTGDTPIDALPPFTTTTATAFRPSLASILLREFLPVVHVQDDERERTTCYSSSCAVCLYDMRVGEEIRRLPNCKHMFHKDCLDRWMDLDHRTCPLCRTPFLRDRLLDEFNQRLLEADAFDQVFFGAADSYHHNVFSDPL